MGQVADLLHGVVVTADVVEALADRGCSDGWPAMGCSSHKTLDIEPLIGFRLKPFSDNIIFLKNWKTRLLRTLIPPYNGAAHILCKDKI